MLASPEIAWLVARRARGAGASGPGGWTAFTIPVGNPQRFVGWVLEFGPDLEVRSPPELRDAVVTHLRRVLESGGAAAGCPQAPPAGGDQE